MSSARLALILFGSLLARRLQCRAGSPGPVPAPAIDAKRASASAQQTAVISVDVSGEFKRSFST